MTYPIIHLSGSNPSTVTAYKLLRLRRNGSLAPLFINARQIIPLNQWINAEDHPTKGYAHRPGWHAAPAPHAPHLGVGGKTTSDRVWCEVELKGWTSLPRPKAQGGSWYLAEQMKVIRVYGVNYLTAGMLGLG